MWFGDLSMVVTCTLELLRNSANSPMTPILIISNSAAPESLFALLKKGSFLLHCSGEFHVRICIIQTKKNKGEIMVNFSLY